MSTVPILDVLGKRGEDFIKRFFASFSCAVNLEIERFIKEKAIDFAKRRLSITYLVTDTDDGEFLGYFTLTHKAILLNAGDFNKELYTNNLSIRDVTMQRYQCKFIILCLSCSSTIPKTMQRKLTRYSRLDKQTGNYMASAFLLAQFGKNYGVDGGKRISGAEMMELASDVLINIQRQIGGGIIYLDCEDKAKLISFYGNEGFQKFDERFSEEDNQRYVQLMRFL